MFIHFAIGQCWLRARCASAGAARHWAQRLTSNKKNANFEHCQSYIMVERLDSEGSTIEGFEAAKSILRNVDGPRLSLLWDGVDTRKLGGRQVQIRLHSCGARPFTRLCTNELALLISTAVLALLLIAHAYAAAARLLRGIVCGEVRWYGARVDCISK